MLGKGGRATGAAGADITMAEGLPDECRGGAGPSSSGDWRFLGAPGEQLRHAVVASLAELHAPGGLADLGCGRGDLLRWLNPRTVTGYLGIDADQALLAGITHPVIPVETAAARLDVFDPAGRTACVLVCAEVLYYLDGVERWLPELAAGFTGLSAVIVTQVVPRPEKPNWQRSVTRTWKAVQSIGWPERERVRISSASVDRAWDIVVYDLNRTKQNGG